MTTPAQPRSDGHSTGADRNLLFGLNALQNGRITREGLLDGMQAWFFDKSRPLAEVLVEKGHLTAADRELLEPLVEQLIRLHGGSVEQSLAELSSVEEIAQSLKELGDPDLNASLVVVARGSRVSPAPQATGEPLVATEQSDVPTIIDAPRMAGRFRIVRPFKEGGLGQVSIAEDMELHREVAFKEIKPKYERDSQNRARFLLEGEITGKLEHPGIVPVYGLGQFSDGRPFYAMRFIRGQSLHDAIKLFHSQHSSNRLSYALNPEFRHLIGRLIDVCQAIEYAHSKGVLHRDLKPDNVMLGKYGETLVVDWGLAKKIDSPAPDAAAGLPTEPPSQDYEPSLRLSPDSGSSPTVVGQTMGTPKYMSPEQARGEIDKLGHATDVYALGAILFSVLTNQPPIGARPLPAGPEKLTAIECVQRAAAGKFPRPTTVNPAAPRALEAVCLCAMSLRAESRYRTAKLLADDLQAWLDDQPVSAMIEPFSIRAQRWMKQHRTAVTTTAAMFLMSFVGVIGWGVLAGKHARDLENEKTAIAKANKEVESKNQQLEKAKIEVDSHNVALQDRVVRQYVANGVRLMDEGDLLGSLPWFAEALRLDQGDPNRVHIHRMRISAVLRQSPQLVHVWPHKKAVGEIEFSADGRYAVTDSFDSRQMWDLTTGDSVPTFESPSSVGRLVVKFDDQGRGVQVVDAASGIPIGPIIKLTRRHRLPSLCPNSSRIAIATENEARVWDGATGAAVTPPLKHSNFVHSARFSGGGQFVVTASEDFSARVWNATTGASVTPPLLHNEAVNDARFSLDGRLVITACADGTSRLWDATTGEPASPLLKHRQRLFCAAVSPDGSLAVTAGGRQGWSTSEAGLRVLEQEGEVRVWRLSNDELVMPSGNGRYQFDKKTSSPDRRYVVRIRGDNSVVVLDTSSGELVGPPITHAFEVFYAALAPDYRRLVTACGGQDYGRGQVWDVATGEPLTPPFLEHNYEVHHAAFSPDGRFVITTSMDHTARIWDAHTGRQITPTLQHRIDVTYGCFSDDGRLVATICHNLRGSAQAQGEVRVWDAVTGEPITPPLKCSGYVNAVKFSSDGTRLIMQAQDESSIEWNLSPVVLPVEDAILMADVLACQRVDENGRMIPLDTAAQHAAWQTLRSKPAHSIADSQEKRIRLLPSLQQGDDHRATHAVQRMLEYHRAELAIRQQLAAAVPSDVQAQRDLSVSYKSLGDMLLQSGQVTEALGPYRKLQEIRQKLAAANPSDAVAQRDLAYSFDNLGDVSVMVSKLDEALEYYTQSLVIRQKLAAAIPTDAGGQRNLSDSYKKLAEVTRNVGQARDAITYEMQSLEIRERLAAATQENSKVKLDLAINYRRLGDESLNLGDIQTAKTCFEKTRELCDSLVANDSENIDARWELAVSRGRFGMLSLRLGDASLAEEHYKVQNQLLLELTSLAPDHASIKRDLSISYDELGDVRMQAGEFDEAVVLYSKCLAIRQKLATAAPKDDQVQRELMVSHYKLGEVIRGQFQFSAARGHYERALTVLERFTEKTKLNPFEIEMAELNRQIAVCDLSVRVILNLDVAVAQDKATVPQLLLTRVQALLAYTNSTPEDIPAAVREKWSTEQRPAELLHEARRTADRMRELASKQSVGFFALFGGENPKANNLYDAGCCFGLCLKSLAKLELPEMDRLKVELQTSAIDTLKAAIAAGFKDIERMSKDADLERLREMPEFHALVKQLKR